MNNSQPLILIPEYALSLESKMFSHEENRAFIRPGRAHSSSQTSQPKRFLIGKKGSRVPRQIHVESGLRLF